MSGGPYREPAHSPPEPAEPPPPTLLRRLVEWWQEDTRPRLRHCVRCPQAAVGGCVSRCVGHD